MNRKKLIIIAIALFGFTKLAKADFEFFATHNTAASPITYWILDASFSVIGTAQVSTNGVPSCMTTSLSPAYIRYVDPCSGALVTFALNSSINTCAPGDPAYYVRNASYAATSGCGGYTLQVNL